jgi:drug/metabolite transporter (DMT)-like permease
MEGIQPRYLLGILAAAVGGVIYMAASVLQKRAVSAIDPGAPLMRRLLRSPLWLAAFGASFALGVPLSLVAYLAIGPTLPPALACIGLAAVPVLSRLVLGERPSVSAWIGAGAVALGVAFIGLTGLSINLEGVSWLDRSLLLRAGGAYVAILCLGLIAVAIAAASPIASGPCLAIAAGFMQALANALMAPVTGGLGNLLARRSDPSGFLIALAAGAALVASSSTAVVLAQLAYRRGLAVRMVPLQQVPVQIVPPILHILVYGQTVSGTWVIAALSLGVAALLVGGFALSARSKLDGEK